MSVSPSEIQGIGAAPGIVIGKVFLLDRRSVIVPHVHLDDSQIEAEIQRFHRQHLNNPSNSSKKLEPRLHSTGKNTQLSCKHMR